MPEIYETRVTNSAGRVRSASVDARFGGETSLTVETYGTATPASMMLWQVLVDGEPTQSQTFTIAEGADTGGVDLQVGEYRGLQSLERELGEFSRPEPQLLVRPAYNATLSDAYAAVPAPGSGAPVDTEQKAREALTSAGISLVVKGLTGVWRGQPPESMRYETVSVMEFLQATLLKTGARWWLDGNTLTIDGSQVSGLGFSIPNSDRHLVTAHTWADEYPTVDEPEPEPAPNREDFLQDCPEYEGERPPAESPEDVRNGTFINRKIMGLWPVLTIFTRTNSYNAGRLVSTEYREETLDKLKLRTLTTFSYHPLCPAAMVSSTETTWATAELSEVDGAVSETALAIYNALSAVEPFVQSERKEEREYHFEGWLQRQTETSRELNVLSYEPVEGGGQVAVTITYDTRVKDTVYEQQRGGQWGVYTTERVAENVVVYETTTDADGNKVAAVADVQRVQRVVPSADFTDAAPAQMTCPPPNEAPLEPEPDEPCLEFKEREYQDALAKWQAAEAEKQAEYESRLVNTFDRRVHSVTFGVPRLDLELGGSYGGGYIAGVSHQYADDGSSVQATTTLTVWRRL